jgi:hypothetical protein
MTDEADQVINEILQQKYENKARCPFFSVTNGECMLKRKLYKPSVYWQDSHSRGTRSTRFYVTRRYYGAVDCDLMYNDHEQSYFDCILVQDYKPNICISSGDVKKAISIISEKVMKDYGVMPNHIPLIELIKAIKKVKSSMNKEMEAEFRRWLVLHYKVRKEEEEAYVILKEAEPSKPDRRNKYRMVYDLLAKNGSATAYQLSLKLNLTAHQIGSILSTLHRYGIVDRIYNSKFSGIIWKTKDLNNSVINSVFERLEKG